ncbi:unnamed protein product [Paramecium sonneborni]|uniref:Uncharacterized protein n=1 Tax=Paramecium sonneborni TaxID=65129 RepID=A0A8S1M100_9CILI|nr:unnamed protein product [Paramecium sonneborni]
MNIFDIQSLRSYYHSKTNQPCRKRTYKLGSQYKVYSFSRTYSKLKPSQSFSEKIPVISDEKALNQSCQCNECGGKIQKRLLQKQDNNQIHLDQTIKVKYLELDKSPKNMETQLRSSGNPSIHTPVNVSKGRIKYKQINHILQMVHVKSVLSKLVNSQTIKQQQQQLFQSSPQIISEFTQQIQAQKPSLQKDRQSPFIGLRLKTEPIMQQQQYRLSIDTKKFYYPRVSRISQIGASNLLNSSSGIDKKPMNKLVALTSRYKSPDNHKIRTLSQRIQGIYFQKSDLKLKDIVKRQN